MNINNTQKRQVSNYLRSNGIHQEDVFYEMYDHILSGIEEQMSENTNLSFEQAFAQTKENFGPNGFQEILDAKKNALELHWKNMTYGFLKERLSVFCVLAMTVVFFLSWYFLHQQSDEDFESWYKTFLVFILLEIMSYAYITNNSELESYKDRLISVSTSFEVLKNTYYRVFSLFTLCYFVFRKLDVSRSILEVYLATFFVCIIFFSSAYRKKYEKEITKEVQKIYPKFKWG